MRIEFLLMALACGGAATLEPGTARPGGGYSTFPTENAAACAEACAQDSICMAWTYRETSCELKAVAPAPMLDASATSGLSDRAPAFARLTQSAPAPELRAELPDAPPAAPSPEPPAQSSPTAAALPDDSGLLGGPEADPPHDLRARLGDPTPRT